MRQTHTAAVMLALLIGITCSALAVSHAVDPETIRLAIVITPKTSGLIDFLADDFKKKTGHTVEVTSTNKVYQRARNGKADIVISHYGKSDLERFVLDGYGLWPKMVFSNQAAIIGPESDPAGIRSLAKASQALARIASTQSAFIVNSIPGINYLSNLLLEMAGRPDKGEWFLDAGVSKADAVQLAEEKGGYLLWGAWPFLQYKKEHKSKMEILLSDDPVLQRVMAAVLVNPDRVEGVNSDGASAFLEYLLQPETQSKIAAFRAPGNKAQLWWPAARDN